MTLGFSTTNLANNWLNMLRGTAFTAPTGVYAKLHIGDPGAAGTNNASAVTTRQAVTFGAASAGAPNSACRGNSRPPCRCPRYRGHRPLHRAADPRP